MRQRGINGGQIPLTDLNAVTVPGTVYSPSLLATLVMHE